MLRKLLFFVLLASFFGCGGSGQEGPKDAKSGKPSARETIGLIAPETPWEEMSYDEKEYWMIGVVLPITKEMFQEFDPQKFASFGCESCHGPDGEAVGYKMPVADLPPMPRAGTLQYNQIKQLAPEMMKFMEDDVTPALQKMLGASAFDATTGLGVGCADCHSVAGESASLDSAFAHLD